MNKCNACCVKLNMFVYKALCQLSRYSYSLRDGPSGDRIPVGARFSAPVHTGPGSHPASCTVGTGSLLGVQQQGRGADHQHPSSGGVKKKVELYPYSFSRSSQHVLGWALSWYVTFTFIYSELSSRTWRYGGVEVQPQVFLMSAVEDGKRSASRLGHFVFRKEFFLHFLTV